MKKVILAVAPVGKYTVPGIKNPLTPEEIAGDVISCAAEGASMVHLHVRDGNGRVTADLNSYRKTLDLIRKESEILIQGSTGGGAELSLEDRSTALNEERTQLASLNMGSTNFGESVYINSLRDIRYWAERMTERSVVPELEIFSPGMIASVHKLCREGVLSGSSGRLHFNFALGFEGAAEADMDTLAFLKGRLPWGASFGLIHNGGEDFALLAGALSLGAAVIRVGFEDSVYYAPGKKAADNAELVRRMTELIHSMGMETMNIQETAKFMGVSK